MDAKIVLQKTRYYDIYHFDLFITYLTVTNVKKSPIRCARIIRVMKLPIHSTFSCYVLVPPAPRLNNIPIATGNWDFLFLRVKSSAFVRVEIKNTKII